MAKVEKGLLGAVQSLLRRPLRNQGERVRLFGGWSNESAIGLIIGSRPTAQLGYEPPDSNKLEPPVGRDN